MDMTSGQHQHQPNLSASLDGLIKRIGEVLCWLNILLMAVIMTSVILRFVFGSGSVKLEELQWHLYGVMIIMAVSYAMVTNSHVRLDIYYARFSQRTKEKVEFWGLLFLLIPMIVVIFLHSLGLVADSWRVNERSDAPMGLPYRWAFKAFFPLGIGFLGAAALSRLVRAYLFLKKSAPSISSQSRQK